MIKTLQEYRDFILGANRNKVAIDRHHVLPICVYGPDIAENLEDLQQDDHIKLHKQLDISGRYMGTLTRNQKKRENGHIVLTQDDIEGRAYMQNLYLEDVSKLPNFLQEMHESKLGDLVKHEANKFKRLTGTEYPVELGETLENHGLYVSIQKELSKHIYKKLKGF